MKIELLSFIFGVVIALAVVIIFEYLYGKIFGNRKIRQLQRRVRHLESVVQKKNELVKKSLRSMQQQEEKHEQ